MRSAFRYLMRRPRLHAYLRTLYMEEANRRGAAPREIETSIGEVMPLGCRQSDLDGPTRLNLLLPALSVRHVFGGISTALQVFNEVVRADKDARIILTDERAFSRGDNPAMGAWEVVAPEDADRPGRTIVPYGDRFSRTIAVSRRDRFMATAWWTAHLAREVRDWQRSEFGLLRRPPFIYLIQDFEPGFYAWSSRYVLADSTYRKPDETVAVFNTDLLKRFFLDEGYPFDDALVLQPGLNPGLKVELAAGADGSDADRERRIIVYGRPGVERNAFPIIVEGLRKWLQRHPELDWEFVSVGEPHPEVALGAGKKLVSLGKLTIAGYAQEMRRARIGISLMVSPHPSYPPLEMAAFGVSVITNAYKRKDLSNWSNRILSLNDVSPDGVAAALEQLSSGRTDTVERDPSEKADFDRYLEGGTDTRSLAREILGRLELYERRAMQSSP